MEKNGLVFLFPGQGSQRVGMGKDVYDAFPHIRRAYFEAADEILGFSLSKLCFEGSETELAQTQNTQPALLVTSLALLAALKLEGFTPAAVAGHSLGEYSALVAAGVLNFPSALKLVRRRGELMAEVGQATRGLMTAIVGLPSVVIEDLCGQARSAGIVEIANYNEPLQSVISGGRSAVEIVERLAEEAGADSVIRLKVSAPFHSSLMKELESRFKAELKQYTFQNPAIPLIGNVNAGYLRTGEQARTALRKQISRPVRWVETMQRFGDDGFDSFVEVGPSKVLTSLGRQILPEASHFNLNNLQRLAVFNNQRKLKAA